MYRPSFSVTALTLAILTVFGLVIVSQRYRLPLPPVNSLGDNTAAYLRQGAHQPVKWLSLDDGAFLQARRKGLPMLLVIGAPWSAIGRQVDKQFFMEPEIAGFLNRTFVCVRVDGSESPEWLGCLFPLSRAKMGIIPEFQMWVLGPQGRTMQLFARDSSTLTLDPETLRRQLRALVGQWAANQLVIPIGSVQQDDRTVIRDADPAFNVDFAGIADSLRQSQLKGGTGMLRSGSLFLNPTVWSFQYSTGHGPLIDGNFDQLVYSPMFDAVDGGFYHASLNRSPAQATFDKLAQENALMGQILAQRWALNGEAADAELASMTLDFIEEKLGMETGIASAQLGDEQRDHRSLRNSVPPRRMEEFSRDVHDAAWKHLGLRMEINPNLLPFFPSAEDVLGAETQVARKAIMKYRAHRPMRRAENRIASVEGYTLARMIETAHILGDADRLARAVERIDSLADFYLDSEILKVISDDRPPAPGLESYLGLADAYLASYLATARVTDLQRGEAVLRSALKAFATGRPGLFVATGENPPGSEGKTRSFTVVDSDVPEICDGITESSSAHLMRLCHDYARVLVAPDLETTAYNIRSRFSAIASDIGPPAVGFFGTSASMQDDTYFVTVGNRATELAQAISTKSPFRLVVPAVGTVHSEIQKRGPGVYVVRGGKIDGPMTVPQATSQVSPTYVIGI